MFEATLCLAFFVLLQSNATQTNAQESDLASLIVNLAELKPISELFIVWDGNLTEVMETIKLLHESGLPHTSFSVEGLLTLATSIDEANSCPAEEEAIQYGRKPRNEKPGLIMPITHHHRSIFVLSANASQVEDVISALEMSTYNCVLLQSAGLFSEADRLYFYVAEERSLVETIFGNEAISKRPSVGAVFKVRNGRYAFFRNDFFATAIEPSFLWTPSNPIRSARSLFTSQYNFKGTALKASTMSWSIYVNVDDPEDYWGLEITMLSTLGKALNFTFTVMSPSDGSWGDITNGSWDGVMAQVLYHDADLTFGCLNMEYMDTPVVLFSETFTDDFITFVAPPAKPNARSLAIVSPFPVVVWICIAASIPLAAVVSTAIARLEARVVPHADHHWTHVGYALSLTIAHITSQYKNVPGLCKGDGLRMFMVMWLLCCLLLTSLYSSLLKDFLTLPSFGQAVTDLHGIARSTLPVVMATDAMDSAKFVLSLSNNTDLMDLTRKARVQDQDVEIYLKLVNSGKQINIDWFSNLKWTVDEFYSKADGTPLLKVPDRDLFYGKQPVAWRFNAFVPWRRAVNKVMRRIIESGLIHHWIFDSVNILKLSANIVGLRNVTEPEENSNSYAESLKVADFESSFLFCAGIMGVPVIVIVVELIVHMISKRAAAKKKKRVNRSWVDMKM